MLYFYVSWMFGSALLALVGIGYAWPSNHSDQIFSLFADKNTLFLFLPSIYIACFSIPLQGVAGAVSKRMTTFAASVLIYVLLFAVLFHFIDFWSTTAKITAILLASIIGMLHALFTQFLAKKAGLLVAR
ncbi:hypothetical protein [Paenibacillus sp. Marseille-Q4541]|uniref:hypothetical protein n=1 Tax=Paenibacillus sp. Marseille-Q4541 TaxID=2831522 RepID=UPI001BADA3EB|nr:hypothetical protein [Paenibacillus sp. Marseille-Q4541]